MTPSSRMHALPSFTLVLTSKTPIRRRLLVFIEPELQYPTLAYEPLSAFTSSSDCLMKTIDRPMADGLSVHSSQDDSATYLRHDEDDDTKTIFEEKRPAALQGDFVAHGTESENGPNTASLHSNLFLRLSKLKSVLGIKMANTTTPKSLRH